MVDYAVPTNALQIFDRKKPAVHHLTYRVGQGFLVIIKL